MNRANCHHFTIRIPNQQESNYQLCTPPKQQGHQGLFQIGSHENKANLGSSRGQKDITEKMSTATTIGEGRSSEYTGQVNNHMTSLQLDSKCTLSFSGMQQQENAKKSLINALTDLDLDIRQQIPEKNSNRTQLYECLQAHSIHESDEDDESDRMSEVVNMTEQEHEHFHTFMQPAEEQFNFCDFSQRFGRSQNKEQIADEPQNKRKVIKNFFRPKDSLVKDDKTCCSSQIWNETKAREVSVRLKTTVQEVPREQSL